MSLAYYYPVTGPAYDVFVACGVPMFSRTQGGNTEYYVLNWGEALAIVDAAFGEDDYTPEEEATYELLALWPTQIYLSTESLTPPF